MKYRWIVLCVVVAITLPLSVTESKYVMEETIGTGRLVVKPKSPEIRLSLSNITGMEFETYDSSEEYTCEVVLYTDAGYTLPEMIMTPHQAWQRQIKGEVETIALEQLVGRVSANMILPYPPGVPLLMPGEMLTKESRTVLDFLLMLCSVGQHYPGFETDIHGAKQDEDGVYRVRVLKMAG